MAIYKILVEDESGSRILTSDLYTESVASMNRNSIGEQVKAAIEEDLKAKKRRLELDGKFIQFWDTCPDLSFRAARQKWSDQLGCKAEVNSQAQAMYQAKGIASKKSPQPEDDDY